MRASDVSGLITFVGGLTQFGGCVLFALIFGLLQRGVRRAYFARWAAGWLALAGAMGALLLRRLLLPGEGPLLEAGGVVDDLLKATYQAAKLAAYSLFLLGVLRCVRGRELPGTVIRVGAALLVLLWGASVLATSSLSALVVWQAPAASALLLFAGLALLAGVPLARRSLGTRMTGVVFCLAALLWLLYVPAFGRAAGLLSGAGSPLFGLLAQYNTYADFLLLTFLGVGMIVILMEDARRQAEDAHDRLAVALAELRSLAHTDPLTGCLNRQAYSERFEREPAPATRGAVVVVDLDNLKLVNDRWGHAAGDLLLRHAAAILRAALPGPTWLFRWGGDEFLLVAGGCTAADAQRAVEEALAGSEPLRLPGGEGEVRVEASVGAGEFLSSADLEGVVRVADRVMYAQKQRRKRGSGSAPAVV